MQETSPRGSKNGNLSYSHVDLHACTDRELDPGAKSEFEQKTDGDEGRVCAQCGSSTEPLDPFHNGKQLVLLHTNTCKQFYDRARRHRA